MKLRSRYLIDLTTPEVESYFKAGGKTAYLPAGSVESHGPHMPIGTDTMIAKAFSLCMAEETNGIVFPEIHYMWAGATDGIVGTVSIPPETDTVTWIAIKATKMGFKRFVVVSVHGASDPPLIICVNRLYETHGIVAQYLNPWRSAVPSALKLFSGKWADGMEASLMLASLEILGRKELYSEKEIAYNDPAPPLAVWQMGFIGATGYFYQDVCHHAAPTQFTSKERGRKYMEIQVKASVPGVLNLDKYAKKAKKEKNQGWFRDK